MLNLNVSSPLGALIGLVKHLGLELDSYGDQLPHKSDTGRPRCRQFSVCYWRLALFSPHGQPTSADKGRCRWILGDSRRLKKLSLVVDG